MTDNQKTFREIWNDLSKVDVSKHIEERNGLSFLSWAWALSYMNDKYPEMTYEFRRYAHPESGEPIEVQYFSDQSAMVECTVTIHGSSRSMWLPVMDYKNKAIPDPDAFAINKAKMRCLVKCFAMFGLGFHIYAGEDLPLKGEHSAAAANGRQRASLLDTPDSVDTVGALADQQPEQNARMLPRNAGDAKLVVDKMIEIIESDLVPNEEELYSVWDENSPQFEHIRANYADEYARLRSAFAARKQSFNQSAGGAE